MKNIEDIKSSLRRSSSIVSGLVLLTGLDRVYENIRYNELYSRHRNILFVL